MKKILCFTKNPLDCFFRTNVMALESAKQACFIYNDSFFEHAWESYAGERVLVVLNFTGNMPLPTFLSIVLHDGVIPVYGKGHVRTNFETVVFSKSALFFSLYVTTDSEIIRCLKKCDAYAASTR